MALSVLLYWKFCVFRYPLIYLAFTKKLVQTASNIMGSITIKSHWTGLNIPFRFSKYPDQKKILDYAFEIAAELGIYGERDNFRLVLDFLAEHFSEWHMPFTAVFEATKEYCGL